jgi:hypothetical protein
MSSTGWPDERVVVHWHGLPTGSTGRVAYGTTSAPPMSRPRLTMPVICTSSPTTM